MAGTKKEKWLGGPIRWGVKGPTFVIERWVNGRHFHVSTKCRTERAALKELEKFEQSPLDYRRTRNQQNTGLVLTPALIAEYLEWMNSEELSAPYIREHKRHLGEVMVALEGRDFRRIGFVALREIIDSFGKVAKWNRTKTVKAFASWLRRHKGALPRAEDPTLDLLNPVQAPEKSRRRKAMDWELVDRAIPLMKNPEIRDIAVVLRSTGAHISEIMRFAEGVGGLHGAADWQTDVLGNLLLRTKTDMRKKQEASHVIAIVDADVMAALQRIRARGKAPSRGAILVSDEQVSEQMGERFAMGSNRHSVATWLAKDNRSAIDIKDLLGHTTTKMAERVYIDLGISARPIPVPKPKLRLVDKD